LHYENGTDRTTTSFHLSCEVLVQGDAPATIYFNVLAARVYTKRMVLLRGRGVLFVVADDVKIMGPPQVIGELARSFPSLVWEEAELATQTVKNRVFVHPTPMASWCRFLDSSPRN
jgi:hypothetical protein